MCHSGNSVLPVQRQTIILTNGDLLSIGILRINFSEISIEIQSFSLQKMRFKMYSTKWRPFCPGRWVNNASLNNTILSARIFFAKKTLLPSLNLMWLRCWSHEKLIIMTCVICVRSHCKTVPIEETYPSLSKAHRDNDPSSYLYSSIYHV